MPNQVGSAVSGMVIDLLGMDGSGVFDGYGDAGVATLVLDLENGFTVRHNWITDIIKLRSGLEQRISRNDTDRESYAGTAYLVGDATRDIRALLARHAASGSVFLLGLPHEELAIRADSSGAVVPVFASALALCDWARIGQRVVVAHVDTDGETQSIGGVIQDVGADTIELDVAPGDLGDYGGTIMPAKAVYLAPQQNFDRFQVGAEAWNLDALGALPLDFAPDLARIVLSVLSAPFLNAVATVRQFGLIGNTLTLEFNGNASWPAAGQLIETGPLTLFRYKPGVTTLGDLDAALQQSANFLLTGSWTPSSTFGASDDIFATASGAGDHGDVGTGATLTTYNGDGEARPVWSRELNTPGTVTDGIQAMTQFIEHGGIPYAVGTADQADWFRAVKLTDGNQADWQWFKLFMSTVIGKQKKFWLPTWRNDLTFVSKSTNTITVSTTDGSDFPAWWPHLREHIQIVETNETITRAKITAAVDNGNGTRTLTIGVTLGTSNVDLVSWLELCRFEDADSYATRHGANGFSADLSARVVP